MNVLVGLLQIVLGPIYRRLRRRAARRLPAAKLWALAAGANLAKLNGASLTSLHNRLLPMTSRHILRVWWGVVDGVTLREAIQQLGTGGHRAGFVTLHAFLSEGPHSPGAQRALREAGLAGKPVVDFVWRNHGRFKNGDLVAWDFGRVINVARYGFSAGYLPEDEAWEIVLDAARVLQQEYDSWKELSDNYLLGFSYWQDGAEPDQFLAAAAAWLEENPESPWRTLSWSELIE
jgi:hypothetical protein